MPAPLYSISLLQVAQHGTDLRIESFHCAGTRLHDTEKPLLVLRFGALAIRGIEFLEGLAYQFAFCSGLPEGSHLQRATALACMYAYKDEELHQAPETAGVGLPSYHEQRIAPAR